MSANTPTEAAVAALASAMANERTRAVQRVVVCFAGLWMGAAAVITCAALILGGHGTVQAVEIQIALIAAGITVLVVILPAVPVSLWLEHQRRVSLGGSGFLRSGRCTLGLVPKRMPASVARELRRVASGQRRLNAMTGGPGEQAMAALRLLGAEGPTSLLPVVVRIAGNANDPGVAAAARACAAALEQRALPEPSSPPAASHNGGYRQPGLGEDTAATVQPPGRARNVAFLMRAMMTRRSRAFERRGHRLAGVVAVIFIIMAASRSLRFGRVGLAIVLATILATGCGTVAMALANRWIYDRLYATAGLREGSGHLPEWPWRGPKRMPAGVARDLLGAASGAAPVKLLNLDPSEQAVAALEVLQTDGPLSMRPDVERIARITADPAVAAAARACAAAMEQRQLLRALRGDGRNVH